MAVAAEVPVNLPGERVSAEEHGHGVGTSEAAGEDGVGDERAIVGDDDFAEKAFKNQDQTVEGFWGAPGAFLLDLGQKMRRALNRAGD